MSIVAADLTWPCGTWLNTLQMLILTVAPKLADKSMQQSLRWEKSVRDRVLAGRFGTLFRMNA